MEPSKIKYQNVLLASRAKIENIVYREESRVEETCDVGLLFGGFTMLPNRANKAIVLYKEGLIKRVLVTGGIGFLDKERVSPEALEIEAYLKTNGIPKTDILLEPNSRNTYENILFSLKLLKRKL